MTLYDLAMTEHALIYARVSTDERTQVSTPDQIAMARRAAIDLGYVVLEDGVYTDEMSRSVWLRPGLQKLLTRLRESNVSAVVVWQFSRLYGDNEQRMKIYRQLRQHKVRLFDAKKEEENLPGAINKMMSGLRGLLHEFEVDQTSERVHDLHSERAARGQILQAPVFGIGHTPEKGHFINEEQHRHVVRIFEMAADGVHPQEICDRLNAEAVRTPRGGLWRKHNLRRMLRNPIYVGDLIWNRTESYRDENGRRKSQARPEAQWIISQSPLGPLVDRELFEQAGAAIERRWKVKGGGRGNRVYDERLLDGFVFCERCDGKRMYPRRSGHRSLAGERSRWFTYACAVQHTMSEGKIQRALRQLVVGVDVPDMTVVFQPRVTAAAREEEAAVERALKGISEKSEKQLAAFEAGYLDLDEFGSAKQRLRQERATMQARLAELRTRSALSPMQQDALRAVLARTIDALTDEQIPLLARRQLLASSFSKILVGKDSVRVTAA
jgi:site-specific DNA recombinase